MNLVHLILVCSVAGSSANQALLYQIAQTANQSQTYIDDLTARKVYDPPRLKEAAGITRALVESGHELRVGLTQLPARQTLREYDVTPRVLVDACRNVALGSARLRRARKRFPDSRFRALSFYFTGDPQDPVGLGWAREVLAARSVDIEYVATHPSAAPPSPGYPAPKNRMFPAGNKKNPPGGRPEPPASHSLFPDSKKTSDADGADSDGAQTPTELSKFPAPDEADTANENTSSSKSKPRAKPNTEGGPRRLKSSTSGTSSAYRSSTDSGSSGDGDKRPLPPVTDEKLPVPESSTAGEQTDESDNQ